MKKKEWHKTKQRRIWAVNLPARAVPWAVTQGELLVQALAVTLVRMVLAPRLVPAWGHPRGNTPGCRLSSAPALRFSGRVSSWEPSRGA